MLDPIVLRRLALPLLVLAAACAVPACGSKHAPSDELGARLESDTGVAWGVVVDPRSQAPRVLSPAAPVRLDPGNPEAGARAFFARYGKQLGAAGTELRLKVNEQEPGGGTYLRFQHFVPGTELRVFDVSSMAHFDASGAAYVVAPGFRAGLDAIPHVAAIAPDAALRAAMAMLVSDCGIDAAAQPTSAPELGVAADEDAPLALAYRIPFAQVTDQCLSPQVDVDATTGAILRTHAGGAALTDQSGGYDFYMANDATNLRQIDVSSHWHLVGNDTYSLESEASPKVITQDAVAYSMAAGTTGETFTQDHLGRWDTTSTQAPGSAVDAHFNVGLALHYFQEAHGRHGIDGNSGDVHVVVHDNEGNPGGANAHRETTTTTEWFFFHVTNDQVTVGDGDLWLPPSSDRRNWKPMSVAFDVMAHEVAHGVTAHTSNLKYFSESGALNETFSDVMGISADQWRSPERHLQGEALIGDRITTDQYTAMRDMNNPKSEHLKLKQPDQYSEHNPCATPADRSQGWPGDSCGVHIDSGIGNRAWSLMTLGGTHASSRIHVSSPIGWEKSRVLWYETFTRLREQSTIREAALAQLAWAWQYDRSILNTVGCAWYAVGAIPLDATIAPLTATLFCPADPAASDAGADADAAPPPAPPPATSGGACTGHADGWTCDPSNPGSAYACNGGAAAGTTACADLSQRCKPRSASDPTATVDASGALVCE